MTTRMGKKTVTFGRPFALAGLDEELPAGPYVVETDDALLEGISFLSYQRTSTLIHLPPPPGKPGITGVLAIDPNELEAALERDRTSMESPASWASSHDMLKGRTVSGRENADGQAIERGEEEGMIVAP